MTALSSALSVPFRVGSALRGARVFHPRGATFEGVAELESSWWPRQIPRPTPVVARVSRAIGTPDGMPDVLGLAVRFATKTGPWDVLLASAHLPARVALLPARSWSSARYSTLIAYRTDSDPAPRWITAVPRGRQPSSTTSVQALEIPLEFSLLVGSARGPLEAAGRLTLTRHLPEKDSEQPSFDPTVHCPGFVDPWPGWLVETRRDAYRASRAGRGAFLARPQHTVS
ncbi:phosphodiesterase [Rhodococcus pyridinivorans]|uniref:phosphodiesterase n=1 Tax=Rhodococcus pyridinivorans TaxID=103816 RepID=UPI00110E5F54|nr:phosphodiesterase [Rhodococcus pyridinivorans]